MKSEGNAMQTESPMHDSPRCGARTRSGKPCQSPAVRGKKRCRMHGGTNPGAPRGPRNGSYRHGEYTKEAIEMRRRVSALIRESREMLATF